MPNILQKLGLIEPVESEPEICVNEEIVPDADVDISDVKADDVVADIYTSSGLDSVHESIFVAEKFMNTLPAEMPKEMKRTAVVGIISAANMNLGNVIEDANKRLLTLDEYRRAMTSSNTAEIENAQSIIAEKTAEIEEQKTRIFNINADQEKVNESIDCESRRICALIEFLKEEEK